MDCRRPTIPDLIPGLIMSTIVPSGGGETLSSLLLTNNPTGIGGASEVAPKTCLFRRKRPSGLSSASTAQQVTDGIDGSGLTAIVTGASSGIGSETVRVLALRGVNVVMGVIDMAAGTQVKEAIVEQIPGAKIDVTELDLSSLQSVRQFASEFTSSARPLNLLINNAGIMATPFKLSADNIELQFATNYLGHFLLTHLLLDTMKTTSQEAKKEGRIVNVSAVAHHFSYKEGIRFDKLNDHEGYCRLRAYGQSKLANILHANELSRRLKEDCAGVTANSLHPGLIATNLVHHITLKFGVFEGFVSTLSKLLLKNVQQGASTTCYVALHPDLKGISGEYFSDKKIAKTSAQAADRDLAKKLWDFSLDLINR